MKKLFALVLALVMVMSLAATGFAVTGTNDNTGKITITGAIEGATYKAYQILKLESFDTEAKAYQYTATTEWADWLATQTTYVAIEAGTGYVTWVDGADVKAFAAAAIEYAKENTLTAIDPTTASGTTVEFTGLNLGYYLVDSSIGILCSLNTTDKEVEVEEKNEKPSSDKKITGASSIDAAGEKAIQEVGKVVEYTGTVTVQKGSENYVFHDKMDSTLTFSGIDVVEVKIGDNAVDSDNYTVALGDGSNDTFTVTFDNDYTAGLAAGTEISIVYYATVNSTALTIDSANNTAYVSYGDANEVNKTPIKSTEVYNAQIAVNKQDGDENALAGAGFVLAKKVADTSEGAEEGATKYVYYKLVDGAITWVDDIANAEEHISDDEGKVAAFTGLADGTYYLVEKTVPAGYNKAADTEVIIAASDFTADNLSQTKVIVNNSGTELPSTGGMGTTLFYVVGGIMVLAAVVLLVTKKRMSVEG